MKLKNKSILITGGAGFVGSHLTDELIEHEPEKIVIVDNMFLGKEENLEQAKRFENLKMYHQSASDFEFMKKVIEQEGIEVVFDLAVIPLLTSFDRPKFTFEEDVNIPLILCELLREDCYETLIHYSSSESYGSAQYIPMDERHPLRPTNSYGAAKAAADLLIMSYISAFGIDAAILRLFSQFGPRQNEGLYAAVIPITVNRIIEGKPPIIHGDGEQTRDFLYVKDTIRATMDIYERNIRGRIVNIGSGKETSINELIHLICKIMNCMMEPVYQDPRPGDVEKMCADITQIKRLIDFEPKSMEEGLKNTIEWYKQKAIKKGRD
jgi:UDP-glucose 4-epimerase